MNKPPIDNQFFSAFMRNLAQFFEGKGEVVLHDFREEFAHSVVEIAGPLSGRKVGDNTSDSFIEMILTNSEGLEANPVYFSRNEKGAVFKTCSTLIRDDQGKIIGAVCINYDVSDLILAQNAIFQAVRYTTEAEGKSLDDVMLAMDVDSLMQHYIAMAEHLIGKPSQLMSKEEKVRALAYLDSKGVFKIHKAGIILCDIFQISKYTLYSYLDEAKLFAEESSQSGRE